MNGMMVMVMISHKGALAHLMPMPAPLHQHQLLCIYCWPWPGPMNSTHMPRALLDVQNHWLHPRYLLQSAACQLCVLRAAPDGGRSLLAAPEQRDGPSFPLLPRCRPWD
jgi:hypothetical protein